MHPELYRRHRPTLFKGVVGQPDAVRVLHDFVKRQSIPHALLFTGPSGCGKTTLARIMQVKLECSDDDFSEINAADFRGIDTVRDIRMRMNLAPLGGKTRVWLIDEAHQMVSQAQNALLKMLEDPPAHVYFMLATTDPAKLLKTIVTRCTEVRVKPLSPAVMEELIKTVAAAEGVELAEDVRDKLVNHADGSARKALVLLNSIIKLEDQIQQLAAIEASDIKPQAIKLAQLLIAPNPVWLEVAKVVKSLSDEDPEQLRWMILGYAKSVLLGGRLAGRAALLIQCFERNFYDSKHAGLALACWEACTVKR